MRRFAHHLQAARCPTAGGARLRLWSAFYGAKYLNDFRGCNVAKAPARGGGRALRGGATRLESARWNLINRRGNRKTRPGLVPGPLRQANEAPDHVRGAERLR